jgi:cytochrome c oxidase assembly factor 5
MANSCNAERELVLACLHESPCIAEGRTVKECLDQDPVCKEKRTALMNCKRGQLDMRKRIKGNFVSNETSEADRAQGS